MSMHKIPLTEYEREGLEKHGLAIGTPSQQSDVFRQGMAWQAAQSVPVVGEVVAWRYTPGQFTEGGSIGNFSGMRAAVSRGYEVQELIVQPTNSISAAELERLRNKADAFDRLAEMTTHEVAELAMRARNDFDGDLLAAIAAEGEK